MSSGRVQGAADRDRVCVGAIAGAQGIRGAVRIKPFTDEPEAVAAYGPVADESGGRRFEVDIHEVRGGMVIATLSGLDGETIDDRNAAEALKGLRLYVARDALPPPDEDEYYHADLLGLAAETATGEAVGTIRAIIPAGATEVLEIDRGPGIPTLLVPFTREAVPEVDVKGGRIVVDPPEEIEAPPEEKSDGGAAEEENG